MKNCGVAVRSLEVAIVAVATGVKGAALGRDLSKVKFIFFMGYVALGGTAAATATFATSTYSYSFKTSGFT